MQNKRTIVFIMNAIGLSDLFDSSCFDPISDGAEQAYRFCTTTLKKIVSAVGIAFEYLYHMALRFIQSTPPNYWEAYASSLLTGAFPSMAQLNNLMQRVAVVFDLRSTPCSEEEGLVQGKGGVYVNIPFNLESPKADHVEFFLKTLIDNGILNLEGKEGTLTLSECENAPPFFVHCTFGADRTGFMSAIYEMFVLNDSADRAIAKMDARGHHKWMYPELQDQLRAMAGQKQEILRRVCPSAASAA